MKTLKVTLAEPLNVEMYDLEDMEKSLRASKLTDGDRDQSNGFYDFLRPSFGKVVGVRWCPFPQAEFVFGLLPSTPRLSVRPNGQLRSLYIWFGEPAPFDQNLSDDQAFFYNRVLEDAGQGTVSVTFGLRHLSESEIEGIAALLKRM